MIVTRKQIIIQVLFLIGFSQHLSSQPQYVGSEVYGEENGLPNNEISCILKDIKGYLWIGTSYGLAKYDGNKFLVYNHQSNANSISGDVITALVEDRKGNILVGANGLSVLNRSTNRWQNYLYNPYDQNSISSPNVTSIVQENDSIYWVMASNGLNRFNMLTGKFQHLNLQLVSRVTESRVHSIVPGKSITFSILHTLYNYDISTNRASQIFVGDNYRELEVVGNSLVGIKNQSDNTHHLVKFNLQTKRETILIKNVGSHGHLFKKQNHVYLIDKNRVMVFNSTLNVVETLVFESEEVASEYDYHCAIREANGTFWLGTTTGVVKVLPKSPFQLLDKKSGLPNEYIRTLTVDSKNNLWIGVRQGSAIKIPNIDKFLAFESNIIEQINFPTPDGRVYATNHILELRNGNLIFVTNQAIYHYNSVKKVFTDRFNIYNNRQYFSAVEIPGGILIGSLEKPTLFRLKIDNNKFKHDLDFRVTNKPDIVYSLFTDNAGQIWVGGEGLFRLNPRDDFRNPILEPAIGPINEQNLSNNSFWSIANIDDNRLALATTTNGFYVYDKKTKSFQHFGKVNGLSTDFICTAINGVNGNIWLSTKEGIMRIDTATNGIKRFPVRQGEYTSDFTFKCGAQTLGSNILFGSKQGIMYFHPDSVSMQVACAPLYINEFRVFDSVVKREITHADTISLNHNENFFTLEFSLLDYRKPHDVEYFYQLVGYDKEPRKAMPNQHSVSYTNVPPGNYTFSLSSQIPAEANTKQSIMVKLRVKPALYQTLWFNILVITVVAVVLLWVVYSSFRRRILYGRLQKMELDLLRSQINPHFIFNTLTSIQHTILANPKEVAVDTLSRFAKLMRMFLDYSRLQYIPLAKALEFYTTYVEVHSVNLDERIDFKISLEGAIDKENIWISPMLIQPFIENAIVHGLAPKGSNMKLTLEMSLEKKWLLCVIDDNGIGREKAMQIKSNKAKAHRSAGIDISSKSILLELKKGKFIEETFEIVDKYDSKQLAMGTTVYLKIPYSKDKTSKP